MENVFITTQQNRKLLYQLLTKTPKEVLVKIPEGFRNNIWWNIAHILVTQQLLVYRRSGLPIQIDEWMIDAFKKGTVPNEEPTDDAIEDVAAYLLSTSELMQQDYENGLYTEYDEYTTSLKVTLSTTEDAMVFNLLHEGLHLGVVLSLLKAVSTT